MTGRLFIDTNLLVYAMDPSDPVKRETSSSLIRSALVAGRLVVSPQILNECFWVLAGKRKLAPADQVERYLSAFHAACTAPLDLQSHRAAIVLARRHRLSWWDSVALASALQARCTHFVSEDMHDGQAVESLTIVDPFASHARAVLALR